MFLLEIGREDAGDISTGAISYRTLSAMLKKFLWCSIVNFLSTIFLAISHLLFSSTTVIAGDLKSGSLKAQTYEEWLTYQVELDTILLNDDWRDEEQDCNYDWKGLRRHLRQLGQCQNQDDIRGLCRHIRSHISRNHCNILSPPLYRKSHAGTKMLIERYIEKIQGIIARIASDGPSRSLGGGLSPQDKRDLFYSVRQTMGRTALLLQGGSAISMCHLGVVKALHKRQLLPGIVIGTSTGALVAALVGITTDDRLAEALAPGAIDISAFTKAALDSKHRERSISYCPTTLATLERRIKRWSTTGHIFDINVLRDLAQANLGDLTFAEAHINTNRILNITVALPHAAGTPQLLNYITAPQVLIWSAVTASIATSKSMYAPVNLVCKDPAGSLRPFFASDAMPYGRRMTYGQRPEAPLKRIGELFNVNHFIVSQARPYLVPFIQIQEIRSGLLGIFASFVRVLIGEAVHMMRQLRTLNMLPTQLDRLLIDETIPSAMGVASKITIIPKLEYKDALEIFKSPDKNALEKWIDRGERAVWARVCELKVRCGIEFELDANCEVSRR